jgi:hypothetical protein
MPDGRIIGAGLVLTGAALALWGFADRDADETATLTQKVSVVQIDAGSGNVRIETGDTQTTTVREHREFWLLNTGKAHHTEGDKLVLAGDCGWQCEADFVVTVPPGTKITGKLASGNADLQGVGDIDLDAASGNISAVDTTGTVVIDIASGDVTVDGASGPVDLETKSGDVKAGRLTGGPVQAKAASGDIEIELDKPTSVTADAKSGDVQVHVPTTGGATYQVDTDTRSGDSDIKIATQPNGTHVLKLSTASGDVEVTPSDER